MHWVEYDMGGGIAKGWFAYEVNQILFLYGESVRRIRERKGKVVYRRARQKK